tara:strand:- start:127 stop:465 length:339 start_codon:yes stop_codon:yes gene_type:complete
MKITKQLKYATFIYDEDSKEFTIQMTPNGKSKGGYAPGGNSIILNKIYTFAFLRFVIRISQRNWLKGKKVIDKTPNNMLSCNNHEEYTDPNQTTIPWDEENFAIDCTSNEPF